MESGPTLRESITQPRQTRSASPVQGLAPVTFSRYLTAISIMQLSLSSRNVPADYCSVPRAPGRAGGRLPTKVTSPHGVPHLVGFTPSASSAASITVEKGPAATEEL